jgi:hypothetical protein
MIKSLLPFSHIPQRFAFLTIICILLCLVQFALILELFSSTSVSQFSSPPTLLTCKRKLPCPGNSTRFSIHIDQNIQYPNVSYVRSPVFAAILATIRNSSYYTNDSARACLHVAPVDTIDRDRRSKHGYYVYFIEQRLKFFQEWSDPKKIHLIFNHYTGSLRSDCCWDRRASVLENERKLCGQQTSL